MTDILNKKNHYNLLYAYYGALLTKRQQEIFEAYYGEDYSLSEISSELAVSRNAVFDSLKKVEKILDELEEKLQISKRNIEIEKTLKKYEDNNQNKDCQALIEEIKKIINN